MLRLGFMPGACVLYVSFVDQVDISLPFAYVLFGGLVAKQCIETQTEYAKQNPHKHEENCNGIEKLDQA